MAQTSETAAQQSEFDKTSLTLRTALHYDPAITAPLESLVKLYQKEDRLEDLIGLYRGHITQYPEDAGAKVVLARILRRLNRAEAGELITTSVQIHPENPIIQHLLYQHLKDRGDSKALEVLSLAIDLETERSTRRNGWLEELLKESEEGAGRNFAVKHLTALLNAEGHTVETLQTLSTRMQRYGFWELSLGAIAKALQTNKNEEIGVDLQMQAAKAEGALGNREQAGKRLDALLAKHGMDFWRRREIMSMRVNLVATEAEREAMLNTAKANFEANPGNESAIMDYVEILSASELRRDAVSVLTKAAKALPNSERLETKTIELLEKTGDERALAEYLQERVEKFPKRDDLRYRLVKAEFLQGKAENAQLNFETVLESLPEADRGAKVLDLGRSLRAANQPQLAVKFFKQYLAGHPGRLDVTRELAEISLELDDRAAAREAVSDFDVAEAEIENFLDLIGFMIHEEFLVESKSALEKRLEITPDHFELSLLLAKVLGKTGNRLESLDILDKSRPLADTPSRYRIWLDSGMEVNELFDTASQFFEQEQQQFGKSDEPWDPAKIEKFLILCDIGKRNRLGENVTHAIRTQLDSNGVSESGRVKLRLLLVKALQNQPDRVTEIDEQLKLLEKEDLVRKDEYQLRRALLYHSLGRSGLTVEALSNTSVQNVKDVDVIRAAVPVFIEFGFVEEAKTGLALVTEAEPTALGNWEKRLSLLAALGRETELRKVIRDLLAGIDSVQFTVDSVDILRQHLFDSHWRSIATLIAKQTPESFAEILPLLESVEREANFKNRLWSLWTRSFVLNALGRTEALEASIEDLTAAAHTENRVGNTSGETRIIFPDGLAISLGAAMDFLTEKNDILEKQIPERTEGPLTPSTLAWAFEVDEGASVIQIEPIGEDLLLVFDDRDTIYAVDSETGKLRWRKQFEISDEEFSSVKNDQQGAGPGDQGISIPNQYYQVKRSPDSQEVRQYVSKIRKAIPGIAIKNAEEYTPSEVKPARRFATDGKTRFCLNFDNTLMAFSAEDGGLIWAAEISAAQMPEHLGVAADALPETEFEFDGNRLIAFSPIIGTVAAFSAESGKLLWERGLIASRLEDHFALNTGMAVNSGRIFVFGAESIVLDSESGETIWKFNGSDTLNFPIRLQKQKSDGTDPVDVEVLSTSGPGVERRFVSHLVGVDSRKTTVKQFTNGDGGSLVAPAAEWATNRSLKKTPASAAISGQRLLLMDDSGVREISLRLPLASRRFEVFGVLLGAVGNNVWFLNRDSITRIDLGVHDGSEQVVFSTSLAGLTDSEGARGLISGSRVYVTGQNGIAIFNVYSGKLISESNWPEAFSSYREKHQLPGDPPRHHYVFQGVVNNSDTEKAPVLTRSINRAAGSKIYTKVGESSVAAIQGK